MLGIRKEAPTSVHGFTLSSDLDFYCFLKADLPAGYEIIAEPQTGYYTEWQFCYKVYRGPQLIKTYEGNFRNLSPGSLVQSAKALLAELQGESQC